MKAICVLLAVFAATAPLHAEPSLVINNRILLKVQGKPITVLDVVKKMDLIFYRQYPDLRGNETARYQFYMSSWRSILSSVVNDQLVMADAEEKKVEITDGDIRETLEDLFGPDVVYNLDKMGLTYTEAWTLLKTELIVRRMNQMMVRPKALSEVHPKEIRAFYQKVITENPIENEWVYQVLTIEGNSEKARSLADRAYAFLESEKKNIADIPKLLKDETVAVRLSEEYKRKESELSPSHKAILETLAVGTHSLPIAMQGNLSRIFVLNEKKVGQPLKFSEMETKLQEELTRQALTKHGEAYSEKLREHYGITDEYLSEMIPDSFEPFTLR